MTTAFQRRAALCALLAGTCLAPPALAQSTTQPTYRNVDANGVDLTAGDFVFAFTEGSIGSGDAELALVRTGFGNSNPGAGGTHVWDQLLFNNTGTQIVLGFGSRSEKFSLALANLSGNGATLSGSGSTYVHTAADGTQTTYTDPSGNPDGGLSNYCGSNGTPNCILLPTSIQYPNGKTITFEWEFWRRCDAITDPDQVPNCSYSPRLKSVSNSYGYKIGFAYVSNGGGGTGNPPLTWYQRSTASLINTVISASAQSSVSYSYPSTGVTLVTDTGGRQWRFSANSTSIGIRRPGASTDTTTISLSGSLVTSVTREGVTTSYSRAVSGSTATMTATDPTGSRVVVSDLTKSRPTSDRDQLNRTTSYQYDAQGRLTRVTQPEGNYVELTLDARGNVTRQDRVAKPGSGLATITTSAAFPTTCSNVVTCNAPTSTTDAAGAVTDFTYDPTHGGVTSITRPAPTTGAVRPQTRFTYTLTNGEYQLTGTSACRTASSCAGTSDEVKTSLSYDLNGNVTSSSTGAGDNSLIATNIMAYDAIGNLLTVDGPLSGSADTVRIRYDGARNVFGVIGPDPDGTGALKHRAVRNTYTNGLLTKTERGTVTDQSDAAWSAFSRLEDTQTGYDTNARPTYNRVTGSDGNIYAQTQIGYDTAGRPICTAIRMNPAVFSDLTQDPCTPGAQGSYGPDRITRTFYNAASEISDVQSGYGTSLVGSDGAYTYTPNGKVQTFTDGESHVTTYEYDGHDRLLKTRYPVYNVTGQSSTTDYEQLTYDARDLVTSRRLRDGNSISFGYDALGRLTSKDLPNLAPYEYDISYAYNLVDQLTQALDANTHVANFAYDALGRKTSEQSNWTTRQWQYDLAGKRTRLTWGDGFYVTYEYDQAGAMSRIRENGSASLAAFEYDDLGRRTALRRPSGADTTYSYDAVSRLGQLTQTFSNPSYSHLANFGYNPAGQIISRASTAPDVFSYGQANENTAETSNGLNQIYQQGATGITYDGRSNVQSIGSAGYSYTSENRLATAPGNTITWDPVGRLHWTWSGTGPIHWMQYDGSDLIEERDGNGVLARYVFGPGTDEPLVWYEGSGSGTKRWLHADERGSIVAISDVSGDVYHINRFDDYGRPDGAVVSRFGFTGQAWMPELNMFHFKSRVYNPHLGRFMQADQIGFSGGQNLYAYTEGDPLNFTDPTGNKFSPNVVCTGSRIASSCSSGGSSGGLSNGSSPSPRLALGSGSGLGESNYIEGTSGGTSSSNDIITVTASSGGIWFSNRPVVRPDLSSSGQWDTTVADEFDFQVIGIINGIQTFGNGPRLGREPINGIPLAAEF
jgi:RHS repeat-associated protein